MDDKLALLTTARNENEASIIVSILDSQGIPSSTQHKGTGSYLNIYMGMSNFGIDIYVPENILRQAQDLIQSNKLELLSLEDTDKKALQPDNYMEQYNKRRRKRILILTFVFVLPTVISILYNLIKSLFA